MGIIKLILAIGLFGVIIGVIIKILPDQSDLSSKFEKCPECNGAGVIEELRGKVTCHVCRGTGKVTH